MFGSLQGQAGQNYLQHFHLSTSAFDSFVLVEGEKVYTRSTAALRVLKHVGGGFTLLYGFIIIPPFIRDAVYKWISRNRYKWFGKRDTCRLPTPEEKARFLD